VRVWQLCGEPATIASAGDARGEDESTIVLWDESDAFDAVVLRGVVALKDDRDIEVLSSWRTFIILEQGTLPEVVS